MDDLKYYDGNGEHEYDSWEEKCNECALKCIEIGNCRKCIEAEEKYQQGLLN